MYIDCNNLTQEQFDEFCGLLYHYNILYIRYSNYVELGPVSWDEESLRDKQVNFLFKKVKEEI